MIEFDVRLGLAAETWLLIDCRSRESNVLEYPFHLYIMVSDLGLPRFKGTMRMSL